MWKNTYVVFGQSISFSSHPDLVREDRRAIYCSARCFFKDKVRHLLCVRFNIAKYYPSSIVLSASISAFELKVRLSLLYSIFLTPNTGRFYKFRPHFLRRESIVVGLVNWSAHVWTLGLYYWWRLTYVC